MNHHVVTAEGYRHLMQCEADLKVVKAELVTAKAKLANIQALLDVEKRTAHFNRWAVSPIIGGDFCR